MELFLNRVWATLASGIDSSVVTLPLTAGHGARFGTIAAGNKVRIVLLDATTNVSEIMYVTAVSGDNLTVTRAQDGTTGVAHLAGDRMEARAGRSTMESFMQSADIQNAAETTLGTIAGVDTITAAAAPALAAQAATGSLWHFLAAGANTGAATLNIDGQGAVSIVRPDGTALLANDILAANYACHVQKRSGDFVLLNPSLQNGAILITQTHTAFTTTGTGAAYVLTPTIAQLAYSANQRFRVKFHAVAAPTTATSGSLVTGNRYTITRFRTGDVFTNVGAAANASGQSFVATGTTPTTWTNSSTLELCPTLNISGLGAKPLVFQVGGAVKVAAVASIAALNFLTDVEYDGTEFVMLDAAFAQGIIRKFVMTSGTSYTPGYDVKAFYAFVHGATGGMQYSSSGGIGGAGYSEKFYGTPSGSYTYAIGAAGTVAGGSGGTTSFGVMSVTGSVGRSGADTSGSAGGVGSGGDFNATGGTGGAGWVGIGGANGGCGGAGSRCGNGYAGAATASVSGYFGAGGGTGGAGSGATGGIAGTLSNSALILPLAIGSTPETFQPGSGGYQGGATYGSGAGAPGYSTFSGLVLPMATLATAVQLPATVNGNGAVAQAGTQGYVTIIEVIQ